MAVNSVLSRLKAMQWLLLALLPLIRSVSAVMIQNASSSSLQPPCRLQLPSAVVCQLNVTSIDLSGRGLMGQLILTFAAADADIAASARSNRTGRQLSLALNLLNVSGNPGLTGVTVAAEVALASLHVAHLDISGTAMAPVPGRLLNVTSRLLSIDTLTASGTAYAEPMDLSKAAGLLYQMRVRVFALIGWQLASSDLPADLTSHGANRCGSKQFGSIRISGSDLLVVLNRSDVVVTDSIDLSGNKLSSVSGVVFWAGRVDLSDNRLVDLPGAAFQPGSACRAAVTGPPTLLLRRNRLAYASLNSLAAGSRHSGFAGLDLSGNTRLLLIPPGAGDLAINVSAFLDLSGLGGDLRGLARLLSRFRMATAVVTAAAATSGFRLSLADNWIPDLAGAANLVAEFAARGGGNETPAVHLDLSGNPLLIHLNLSDMPPHLLASLTIRRLPRLRSASVRVRDDDPASVGVLERLRRGDLRPDVSILADLWSRRVPLRLEARPARCCLMDDAATEVLCSFGSDVEAMSNPVSVFCRGGVDGFSGPSPNVTTQPPELPLLFTCVVLGCAVMLGLVTGFVVFFARRKSHGRYAVYSLHPVHRKDQHPHQQHHHHRHHHHLSSGCPVQLKAVTVSSEMLAERAATPV